MFFRIEKYYISKLRKIKKKTYFFLFGNCFITSHFLTLSDNTKMSDLTSGTRIYNALIGVNSEFDSSKRWENYVFTLPWRLAFCLQKLAIIQRVGTPHKFHQIYDSKSPEKSGSEKSFTYGFVFLLIDLPLDSVVTFVLPPPELYVIWWVVSPFISTKLLRNQPRLQGTLLSLHANNGTATAEEPKTRKSTL